MWIFIIFISCLYLISIKGSKNSYKCNPSTGANLCWWKYIFKSANFSQIKDITSLDYCLCWTAFFFFWNSPCFYIYFLVIFLVRKHLKITNLRNFDYFLNNFVHLYSYTFLFWIHAWKQKFRDLRETEIYFWHFLWLYFNWCQHYSKFSFHKHCCSHICIQTLTPGRVEPLIPLRISILKIAMIVLLVAFFFPFKLTVIKKLLSDGGYMIRKKNLLFWWPALGRCNVS